jgi:alanine racemase
MMRTSHTGLRTWIEIDKAAALNNFKSFRKHLPKKVKIMSVVKSNAYGHSLLDFSKITVEAGADWLAVDSIVEALALRREKIKKPILVLGYTLPEMFKEAVKNDISLTFSNFDYFSHLKNISDKKLKVHLKVDTGMHRHGFLKNDIKEVISLLNKNKIELEGMYTHFAMAKNPAFPTYTQNQINLFKLWQTEIFKAGFTPLCHTSATGGSLLFSEGHFDMARIGIGLYGLWPSKETEHYSKSHLSLKPVLTWKTIVAEIKTLEAGEKIGYDLTEKLRKKTKVAILPIGYWHGYPRALSGVGYVKIKNKWCKVLGRVCMDIIMVDVSVISNLKIGDEVEIIGNNPKMPNSVENLADLSGNSTYELITRLNPLIKRIII